MFPNFIDIVFYRIMHERRHMADIEAVDVGDLGLRTFVRVYIAVEASL